MIAILVTREIPDNKVSNELISVPKEFAKEVVNNIALLVPMVVENFIIGLEAEKNVFLNTTFDSTFEKQEPRLISQLFLKQLSLLNFV
ncbi:hypothetical protein [Mesomycoplasma hyorhinis]|uniref:hypothetical protein n=1 Tax=Mesomycoplasma hyorhinis TaxID=2100 RepID=UPI001C04415B|nr:hypothetical protein [Mesomycoplasma hyorhinis]